MLEVKMTIKIDELKYYSCVIDEYFSFSLDRIEVKNDIIVLYFNHLVLLEDGEYNDKTLCTLVLEEMSKALNEVYIVCNTNSYGSEYIM